MRSTRKTRTVLAGALAGFLVGPVWGLTSASAATCGLPVRYAPTSNTIYLSPGTVTTLTQIKVVCPAAPLWETSPGSGVWQLDADLVLQGGARLDLHSRGSGGDVDQLRLRSASSALKSEVSAVTAQYGVLDLLGVKLTSWDPATGAPDTDVSLPAGAASDARGRAFIRALSYLDTDGVTARTSRMDINGSDLGYLGFNTAESQGVAYKARGCGASTTTTVCAQVGVVGSETNSRFHDNFMGTYTWGADAIAFTGNEYARNIDYGLDPHDDSDGLLIDHNSSHDNGNHGIICSQRCDHLTITNNSVHDNGVIPYVGPNDDNPADNQVHGIMIHRGVTDSIIANNTVYSQPNGAGIAVFDSSDDVVRDNTVTGNRYGIRVSVGSRRLTVTGNTIASSGNYAVFAYQGSDLPTYSNLDGRSSDIVVSANTLNGSGSDIIKLGDADRWTFQGNAVTGSVGGSVRLERSRDTRWTNNSLPSGLAFTVRGSSTYPGSLRVVSPPAPYPFTVDSYSSVTSEHSAGGLARVAAGIASTVTGAGSVLTLTSALVGTSVVVVTPQPVRVLPDAGTLSAAPAAWTATGGQVTLAAGSVSQVVSVVASGLAAGAPVVVTDPAGIVLASGTADSNGEFAFSLNPGRTTPWTFTVRVG